MLSKLAGNGVFPRRPCLSRIFLAIVVNLFAADVHAQSIAECRGIEDDFKRLACYDLQKGLQSATKQPPGNIVASFAGYRTGSTRTFAVRGSWKIHWSIDDGWISIILLNSNGKAVDYFGNGDRVLTGNVDSAKEGTFSLDIITNGRWQIEITRVP